MKQVAEWTGAIFTALNYGKWRGLARIIQAPDEDGVRKYPATSDGSDEMEAINFEEDMAYLRFGNFSDSPQEDESCGKVVERTLPATLVIALSNDVLKTPSAYTPMRIAQNVAKVLQDTNKRPLRLALKSDNVEINVTSVNVDPHEIWAQERSDPFPYPYERFLVSVSINYVITGHISCFDLVGCGDEEAEVLQKYVDSDRVEKEAVFGSRIICTPCDVDFCELFTATTVDDIAECFDTQTDLRKEGLRDAICEPCADGNIENSDSTYSAVVASGGLLVLPDVNNIDSNLAVVPTPAQTVFVATPCVALNAATCAELNDPTTGLTQTQRNFIQAIHATQTGQATNDLGRLTDFFTLVCNNPNGNLNRFEAVTVGGVAMVIDWATPYIWTKALQPAANRATQISNAQGSALGGLTTWDVPTFNEASAILHHSFGANRNLMYAPFSNASGGYLWTSTDSSSAVVGIIGSTTGDFIRFYQGESTATSYGGMWHAINPFL